MENKSKKNTKNSEKDLQNPLRTAYIDELKIRHNEESLVKSLGLSEEEFRAIHKIISFLSLEFFLDPDIDSLSKMIESAFFKHDIHTFHPSIAFLIGLLTGFTIEKFRTLQKD